MTNSRTPFQDVGLPEGHAFPKLAYHPATFSVIAHTRLSDQSRPPCCRLSLRHVTETCYRPLADFQPSVSLDSFTVHPRLPFLYFITFIWTEPAKDPLLREHIKGPVVGVGDWDALYRCRLDTLQSEVVARQGDLVPPHGYQSAWLADVISVSEDGKTIFCRAALRQAVRNHYCLAELSLHDLRLTVLTSLKALFV
jgi:hypothetical protein